MMLRPSMVWPSLEKLTCAENLLTVCTSNAAARACSRDILDFELLGDFAQEVISDIAVLDLDPDVAIVESLLQFFTRTTELCLPPGAPKSQGKTALALALVQRQSDSKRS